MAVTRVLRRPYATLLVAACLIATAAPSGADPDKPGRPGKHSCSPCPAPTFEAPPVQSLGATSGIESSGVHSMAQGDFNGDGVQDLAATGFGGIGGTAPGVGVFLGDGHGGYRAPLEFPGGAYPIDITTAHLRGSRQPVDLVVADAGQLPDGSFEISVLLGNGDGTFGAPIEVTGLADVNRVVSADFNGDGKDDLALASRGFDGTTGAPLPEGLTILVGEGDGSFTAPASYPTGTGLSVFYDMAVGDFNNDGAPDVLGMDPEGLWVSLNSGDGTFRPGLLTWQDTTTYIGGQDLGGPTAVSVGDLNADGNLDAALDVDGARIDVLLGTGTGLLRPAPVPVYRIVDHQMGEGDGTVHVADLTGDHVLDLVTSTGYGATLVVLPGLGDGTFAAAATYPLPSPDDRAIALSDLNRDGRLDVSALTQRANFGGNNYLTVLLNRGQGRLDLPHQYSVLAPYNNPKVTATNPVGLTLADLNGDKAPDLVVTEWDVPTEPLASGQLPAPPTVEVANARVDTHGSVAVLLGDGHGGFAPERQYFVGGRPVAVAAADLTGDGKQDLAVVNGYSGTLSLLVGNGDGTLQPATTIPVGGSPNGIVVRDFNGDRRPDLAVSSYTDGAVSVILNASAHGSLRFGDPVSYPSGVGTDGIVGVDLNEDGVLDLATSNNGASYPTVSPSTLSVFIGKGDGSFAPARSTKLWDSDGADAITAGNFGAGHVDLVVASFTQNRALVLHGDGTGAFVPGGEYAVGAGPESFAVADFNGDGWDDVAVDSINDNTVSVLVGTGAGEFTPVLRRGVPQPTDFGWAAFAYPTYLALGDLDRDGRPDLVTANIFDAAVTVLHNTTPPVDTGCSGHGEGCHGKGHGEHD